LYIYELSDYTPSNTTLGIYVYSLMSNGQYVSTRYRVIIRTNGAYVLVHEKNAYVDDDPVTGRNILPIVPQ
jgi:hypothetical protein